MIASRRRTALVAAWIAGALLSPAGCQPASSPPKVGLVTMDHAGIEQLIDSHRGKIVVVDAWSTSCPPCIKEFPNLVALDRRYGPDRVACVSLNLDYDGVGEPADVRPKVLEFLRKQKATFDNVLCRLEAQQQLQALGVYSLPAVFVYDRSGQLVKKFDTSSGEEFTYADVEQCVASLLKSDEK